MTHPAPPSAHAAQADCASEPIHVPGSIQPHGYLISLDDKGCIVQLSANAGALAGATAQALLGEPLARLIGEHAAQAVLAAFAEPGSDGTPRLVGTIADPRDMKRALDTADATTATDAADLDDTVAVAAHPPLAIVAHRHDGVAIVELEPALGAADVFSSLYPLVRTFLRDLQSSASVDDLARLAASEVKRITGFGRTLVYNFDDDGNGHVIAEAIDPGYASYLDQHFPAADIPPQARALYVRNRIRLIADAGYASVPLVPPLHPATGRPTDLTWASLRSVSPVHVQYMKNMGTGSSMSMSIVVRGRLWGLVSCHHASARLPAFEVRAACEHIAQMLSLQIEAREDRAQAEYRLELRRRLSRLLAAMANSEHFVSALCNEPRDLLGLANAAGAAIVFDGRIVTVGTTPDTARIEQILTWLDRQSGEIIAADQLAQAAGVPFHHDAAGMLAVSISRLFRNYVIWFRPEVVRALKWAGDPREKLSTQASALSPRASFEVWTEVVRGRSLPWHAAEQEIALEFRAALLDIVLRRAEELAQLALELGRANEELEGFSYTVSHDLRAPLRHIAGFADLLAQNESANLSTRGKHFVERIADSARFGGKLVDDLLAFSQMGRAALHKQRVDMNRLVSELVADQRRDHPQRAIEWRIAPLPALTVDPVLMHVVLRNLIDNAVKFSRNRADASDPAIIEIGCRAVESAVDDPTPLGDHDIVFVRDNGVGFDARYVDKLFGVFQRLHRFEDFEGTGIGLASVKRIVERHGGQAWADGKLDVGTTVSFAIPRTADAPPAHNGAPRGESAAAAVARLASISADTQPFRNVRKPE